MCPFARPPAPAPSLQAAPRLIEDPALSLALLARSDTALLVRPPGQPLPAHLAQPPSRLGSLFGLWLRQRDDADRSAPKAALERALAALPSELVRSTTRHQAGLARSTGDWNHWAASLSAASVAALLGLAPKTADEQADLRTQLQALAQGLAPEASAEALRAAEAAAGQLLQALRQADTAAPLQAALAEHAPPARWGGAEAFEANRLALIWQSYEAGTALLAHALKRLGEEPGLRDPATPRDWLARLPEQGGAVFNTRRFVGTPLTLAGSVLAPGEPLLLNLAGADAGFGAGAHRCPGQDLALQIASAAIADLQRDAPRPWPRALPAAQDRLLPNARIPQFPKPQEAQA